MQNNSFRKLISAACVLAMSVSLMVPVVSADNSEDAAGYSALTQLSATGDVLSQNFDSLDEGTLVSMSDAQQTYTGIDGMQISIGGYTGGDSTTKVGVAIEKGVDSSTALAFTYGNYANNGRGPRFTFAQPSASIFKISMSIYPEEGQTIYYGNSASTAPDSAATLGLVAGQWNTVEIYMGDGKRIIEANGENIVEDESSVIPVIWGNCVSGAGTFYLDDVVISSLSALPTAAPTAPPEADNSIAIGDTVTFDDMSNGNIVFINTSVTPANKSIKGFELYIGNRGSGSDSSTNISIAASNSTQGGKALALVSGSYATSDRGPRVKLVAPTGASDYKISFLAKATGTSGDLYFGTSTSAFNGTGLGLTKDVWHSVDMLMFNGKRLLLVDGVLQSETAVTELPVIWGTNAASGGSVYIDNYAVSAISDADILDSMVNGIEIANGTSVVKSGDEYNVTDSFTVADSGSIKWTSSDTSLATVGEGGVITVYPKSADKVTLTAAVTYNGLTQNKDFVLDLSDYNAKVKKLVDDEVLSAVLSPKVTGGAAMDTVTLSDTAVTDLSYDVSFPTTSSSDKNVKLSWASSDTNILSKDGVISVADKSENKITLKKTAAYTIGTTNIYEASNDFDVNVQFDNEKAEVTATAKAKTYAETVLTEAIKDNSAMSDTDKDSTYAAAYNNAMEAMCDRYKTRFDAAYSGNFDEIPSSTSENFDVPTTGYFGSDILWTSSDTAIKISDGTAKVTRPSSSKTVTLSATFTSGTSTVKDGTKKSVKVSGTGSSSGGSSGGSSGSSSSGGGNSYIGSLAGNGNSGNSTTATPAPTAVPGEFTDLGEASWAETAINYMAKKGIVSGRTSTTFAPNDNVTRAEFAKILFGAFDLSNAAVGTETVSFTDVAADSWYGIYVLTCAKDGIITGYEDGTFGPDKLVTRQEMAVMIMRAVNYTGKTVEAVNEKIDFADEASIADYAKDAVSTLQQGAVINGMTADTFAPIESATRAQAAKMLYSFCK